MDHNALEPRVAPLENPAALNRRSFLHSVSQTALLTAAAPLLLGGRIVQAAPTPTSAAETAVGQLYASLSATQKQTIALPFNHAARTKISANWHVTKPVLRDDFFTAAQRQLVDDIVRNVTSPDGYERIKLQTEDDAGGIDGYSIAFFGTPGTDKFEWELTGRHLTLRADGNTVDKAAFGGPIIYGHGEEDPKKNLFLYQTQQVNEVYRALDPQQAKQALIATAPGESAVPLQGSTGQVPRHRRPGTESRSAGTRRKDPGSLAGPLPQRRCRRSFRHSESHRRLRQTPPRVLSAGGPARRQGLGHLARRRPLLRLAFPRSPARPRLYQCGHHLLMCCVSRKL